MDLLSANAFNLYLVKILLFGKESRLNAFFLRDVENLDREVELPLYQQDKFRLVQVQINGTKKLKIYLVG